MLVKFTTDAHSDITMFGDVALAMLKMMEWPRSWSIGPASSASPAR